MGMIVLSSGSKESIKVDIMFLSELSTIFNVEFVPMSISSLLLKLLVRSGWSFLLMFRSQVCLSSKE